MGRAAKQQLVELREQVEMAIPTLERMWVNSAMAPGDGDTNVRDLITLGNFMLERLDRLFEGA